MTALIPVCLALPLHLGPSPLHAAQGVSIPSVVGLGAWYSSAGDRNKMWIGRWNCVCVWNHGCELVRMEIEPKAIVK